MFRIIASFTAIAALSLGASQAAEAHGNGYRHYDSSVYHYGAFHRTRYMPRWLWRKRAFRHWYFRTPLRFNRHMSWWQLHDAFRWERRYKFRRQFRMPYDIHERGYDRDWRDRRYRRDWDDDDRRDRRRGQRRRNRDD